MEGHTEGVNSVIFDTTGSFIASGGSDESLWLWSVVEQKELVVLEGHTGHINSLAFDATGKFSLREVMIRVCDCGQWQNVKKREF